MIKIRSVCKAAILTGILHMPMNIQWYIKLLPRSLLHPSRVVSSLFMRALRSISSLFWNSLRFLMNVRLVDVPSTVRLRLNVIGKSVDGRWSDRSRAPDIDRPEILKTHQFARLRAVDTEGLQNVIQEIRDRWTGYPSSSLCWWQPAVCFLCTRRLYCDTEWFTVMLASVQSWMSPNKVNLNPDKTEFLLTRN